MDVDADSRTASLGRKRSAREIDENYDDTPSPRSPDPHAKRARLDGDEHPADASLDDLDDSVHIFPGEPHPASSSHPSSSTSVPQPKGTEAQPSTTATSQEVVPSTSEDRSISKSQAPLPSSGDNEDTSRRVSEATVEQDVPDEEFDEDDERGTGDWAPGDGVGQDTFAAKVAKFSQYPVEELKKMREDLNEKLKQKALVDSFPQFRREKEYVNEAIKRADYEYLRLKKKSELTKEERSRWIDLYELNKATPIFRNPLSEHAPSTLVDRGVAVLFEGRSTKPTAKPSPMNKIALDMMAILAQVGHEGLIGCYIRRQMDEANEGVAFLLIYKQEAQASKAMKRLPSTKPPSKKKKPKTVEVTVRKPTVEDDLPSWPSKNPYPNLYQRLTQFVVARAKAIRDSKPWEGKKGYYDGLDDSIAFPPLKNLGPHATPPSHPAPEKETSSEKKSRKELKAEKRAERRAEKRAEKKAQGEADGKKTADSNEVQAPVAALPSTPEVATGSSASDGPQGSRPNGEATSETAPVAAQSVNSEVDSPGPNTDFNGLPALNLDGPRREKLSDISADERRLQSRYWGRNNPDDSVHCMICSNEGHMEESCPARICFHCQAQDDHFSSACPLVVKCRKCRERGHQENDCSSMLARSDADGLFCDVCNQEGHPEEKCRQIWSSYNSAELKEVRKVAFLNVSCYYCGDGTHWGDDCPLDQRKKLGGPGMFSWQESVKYLEDPNWVPPPSSPSRLSITPPPTGPIGRRGRPPAGISIKGRAQQNNKPSDEDEDDSLGRNPRVPKGPRATHPLPNRPVTTKINMSGAGNLPSRPGAGSGGSGRNGNSRPPPRGAGTYRDMDHPMPGTRYNMRSARSFQPPLPDEPPPPPPPPQGPRKGGGRGRPYRGRGGKR